MAQAAAGPVGPRRVGRTLRGCAGPRVHSQPAGRARGRPERRAAGAADHRVRSRRQRGQFLGDATRLDPRLHSCHFDKDGNVWIASAPSGMVQKYSHDGSKLLLQIGKKGVLDSSDGTAKGKPLNSNAAQFFMPSSIFVDRANGDVYVSDGEGAGSNRRVAVIDRTGSSCASGCRKTWRPSTA